MNAATYYHGGVAGLRPGDLIHPAPPHVVCGCPVCEARAEGRTLTVGEYREWARERGATAVLAALADAEDYMPVDPPSQRRAVYVTTDIAYARWHAARSGNGDLYRVVPDGLLPEEEDTPEVLLDPSEEDRFPSWTCTAARVVAVVERGVRLVRRERRELLRRWKKADRLAERDAAGGAR